MLATSSCKCGQLHHSQTEDRREREREMEIKMQIKRDGESILEGRVY